MKIFLKTIVVILLLFASCEKSTEIPYTLKFYGDAFEDVGYSIAITDDGYYIAGQTTDLKRNGNIIEGSDKNLGIFKVGWDGNVEWKISAGGKFDDTGSKLWQNPDGSLVCVGTFTDTTSATPSQTDLFIIKVSATGDVEWQKKYGGEGNQMGTDLVKTSDGYMILGTTDVERHAASDSMGNIAGNTDILILKITDNGDISESYPYGFSGNDAGVAIKADEGSGYTVFGTTERSEANTGQGKHNLIQIKVNDAGHLTDSRITGTIDDEYAADMEVLDDGYLLAYNVTKSADNQEVYVKKIYKDLYADPSFTNRIPPESIGGSASVFALSRYNTDSFILAGQSGKNTSGDMLIFEIDTDGALVAGHQMKKGSTGAQVAYDVVSGEDGYIIAVGKNSYDVNSMITFLKFKF